MSEIRKKLGELSKGESSAWAEKAKWRRENRDWLKKSQAIAFEVLEALDEKKMTQKKLAGLMHVTPQYVNNIAKGRENLTLETIAKLEKALNIQLVSILSFQQKTGANIRTISGDAKTVKSKAVGKKAA